MTGWEVVAIILVVIAVLLVLAESVVPSGGLIALAAVTSGVAGIVVAFVKAKNPALGIGLLAGGVIAAPLVFIFGVSRLPRTRFGRKMVLKEGLTAGVARNPEEPEYAALLGRPGRAVSLLRPAGVVEIDGRRYDAQSEGTWIPEGAKIKVVKVEAHVIVVRPMEDV